MIGFSFSPGGLLFPYHLGVIESLSSNGHLTPHSPIAGSSAGAIAVAAYAANVRTVDALEGCIRMSDACEGMGGARGKLLQLLEEELEFLLPSDAHEIVNQRPGLTGLAYKEIFPKPKNILATQFRSRQELKEAICNSSMFPFFTSPWPCLVRPRSGDANVTMDKTGTNNPFEKYLPRLIVDGYFTVPRERFGCPILNDYASRTITISVFPHDNIGLSEPDVRDRISPILANKEYPGEEISDLIKMAIDSSPRQKLVALYERGMSDAEKWSRDHYANN